MEATALGSIVGTMFDWLPKVAVVLAIIWYILQIRESQTWRQLALRRAKPELAVTTTKTTTHTEDDKPSEVIVTQSTTRTSADE